MIANGKLRSGDCEEGDLGRAGNEERRTKIKVLKGEVKRLQIRRLFDTGIVNIYRIIEGREEDEILGGEVAIEKHERRNE